MPAPAHGLQGVSRLPPTRKRAPGQASNTACAAAILSCLQYETKGTITSEDCDKRESRTHTHACAASEISGFPLREQLGSLAVTAWRARSRRCCTAEAGLPRSPVPLVSPLCRAVEDPNTRFVCVFDSTFV
jgi:hypothetical protein